MFHVEIFEILLSNIYMESSFRIESEFFSISVEMFTN